MARIGVAMLLHDRPKLAGTLLGVVFAVVLASQNAALLVGMLARNTLMVDNAGADVWIMPRGTREFRPGPDLPDVALYRAKGAPGVEWAAPLVTGMGTVKLPSGATEDVQVVGVEVPSLRGGPFHLVAGDPAALALPDAITFEDAVRDLLGGINLGSVREVNGHRVHTVALTWGLIPFGPPYAFASLETARELLRMDARRVSFVIVKVRAGGAPEDVASRLRERLPLHRVLTADAFRAETVDFIMTTAALGATFGTAAGLGILVGLVVVALTMFSAVVDRSREYGTLKALGATNGDLAALLAAQSLFVAVTGTLVGEALAVGMVAGMRSGLLAVFLPPAVLAAMPAAMLAICLAGSLLALARLRRLEPAVVFRG
jgi:putative ABC transport system permease protein